MKSISLSSWTRDFNAREVRTKNHETRHEKAQTKGKRTVSQAAPMHIETVRVKPLDPAATSYQFRLGDGNVDLIKAFSLSSDRGIGASWQAPTAIAPAGNTFDERFGQW